MSCKFIKTMYVYKSNSVFRIKNYGSYYRPTNDKKESVFYFFIYYYGEDSYDEFGIEFGISNHYGNYDFVDLTLKILDWNGIYVDIL